MYQSKRYEQPVTDCAATAQQSEVDEQLSNLNDANDYLHSVITDLERALSSVLRENYLEKNVVGAAVPALVPIAHAIRTNAVLVLENVARIRTIINRLGV